MSKGAEVGFGVWGGQTRIGLPSFGFAAQLVTLLIYSGSIVPFHQFDALTTFIGLFASVSLATACIAGAAYFIFVLLRGPLDGKMLSVVAVVLYALGNGGFLYLLAVDNSSIPLNVLSAIITGVSSILLIAAWGRILRQFDLKNAFLNVAASCAIAVLIEEAMRFLPSALMIGVFVLCMAVTAVFILLSAKEDRSVDSIEKSRLFQTVRSLGSVTFAPVLGLAVFAFSMGVMRAQFVSVFDSFVSASCLAALLLAALAYVKFRRSASLFVYQLLLPGLAIAVLAADNIVWITQTQTAWSGFFNYFLYSSVAVVSIATCAAVAHAAEFPSDLVSTFIGGVFAIASLLGQFCASFLSTATVTIVCTLLIVPYALIMAVLPSFQRWIDASEGEGVEAVAEGQRIVETVDDYEERFTHACEEIALQHRLTARETEILRYLARGHTSTYISNSLFISSNTTRTHIHNIYNKMEISSRESLILMVQEMLKG